MTTVQWTSNQAPPDSNARLITWCCIIQEAFARRFDTLDPDAEQQDDNNMHACRNLTLPLHACLLKLGSPFQANCAPKKTHAPDS